ncbi:MAG: hypothetical protein QM736_23005 [Vicinamibacterales bacterium]
MKQRIAESTDGDTTGAVAYARGLRALSGRDYAGAAQWFSAAQQQGLHGATLQPLLAYASMKSGRRDVALQLAANAQVSTDEERTFWEWLRERLAS